MLFVSPVTIFEDPAEEKYLGTIEVRQRAKLCMAGTELNFVWPGTELNFLLTIIGLNYLWPHTGLNFLWCG